MCENGLKLGLRIIDINFSILANKGTGTDSPWNRIRKLWIRGRATGISKLGGKPEPLRFFPEADRK